MVDVAFLIDESGSEEEASTHEWVRALGTSAYLSTLAA
jgi:hypothetical protein